MQQNTLTLEEVKSHFEHWRSTRTKPRERIPQYLWEEVRTLIDRYSLADITKILRINTYQVKDNLKLNAKINFAEARIDDSTSLFHHQFSSFKDNGQTYSVELHRANGVVLKISALPIISLQKIISQFME
jgi:hypothetical protein